MISREDLIGFCDLTAEEVQAIVEHEFVAETIAAVLGSSLLQSERGPEKIRDILMDSLRTAVRQHDVPHARQLVRTLRLLLREHPNAAWQHTA